MRHEFKRAEKDTDPDKKRVSFALGGLKRIFSKRKEQAIRAEINDILGSNNTLYPLEGTLVSVWHDNKHCGHEPCESQQGIIASGPYFNAEKRNISIDVLTAGHLKRIHLLTKVAIEGSDKDTKWIPTGWKYSLGNNITGEIPSQEKSIDEDKISSLSAKDSEGQINPGHQPHGVSLEVANG